VAAENTRRARAGWRAQQRAPAIDGRQHHVHHVGGFERDGPTLRAAAQAGQQREAGDQARAPRGRGQRRRQWCGAALTSLSVTEC
jgi:hypothetical protein